jgi:uncharacterized protein (TIGR02996 family)
MADLESFFRAIQANPDDDTLRLVFADWLDEHNDPARAEFIRVQVELDPIREQIDSPRVRELLNREADLLGRHRREWVGRMTDLDAAHPGFGPVFRRGLPELVCLSLDNFLKHGGELFEDCPTVREVSLYGIAGRGAELATCPHLANVETLEIAEPVYTVFPGETNSLFDSIRAARVQCLRVPVLSDPPFCIPHLFGHFKYGIAEGWLRRIEYMTYTPAEREEAERDAGHLNQQVGRLVAHVLRPYEARFPLIGDLGHGLVAKRNEGRAFLLAVDANRRGCWVFFDDEGRFRDLSSFGTTEPSVLNEWRTGSTGLIRVREFALRFGLSVRLWPRRYLDDYLQNPFERPAGVSDNAWNNRGGVLRRWLHEGRFVIEWDGHELWADSSGTIDPV